MSDKVQIDIDIIEGDPSVQCIHALRQVMDFFTANECGSKLSANGKDRRAVYAWFMERYNPGAFKIQLK